MKLTKSYIASLLLLSGVFTACEEEIACPPMYIPHATITANTEIADLKTNYWSNDRNFAKFIDDDIIVRGRIVSSDATGNIYKSLVIQSETDSVALAFSINESDLYEKYKIGQELVVNLNGAYIGKYNGLLQIGEAEEYNGGLETTFMELEKFQSMAQVDGLPDIAAIDTIAADISELNKLKNSAEGLRKWQSRLVKFENVSFEGGGSLPFSESTQSTNRYILDENGNKLLVRNSSYASFHAQTMPAGTGTVVGILSFYSQDWQLLLRDVTDCIGFDGQGGDTPETPTDPVTSLEETFEGISSAAQLKGWTSKIVAGDKAWYFTSFDNNSYAACTAYKGTDDSKGYDSWLITPALSIDGMTDKVLNFDSQAAYSGGAFEVYAMTTNDPATATLTKLDCTLATPPASGYSGFVPSGEISLSQFTGTIYIGFRYTAETASQSMTFCIDNVKAGIKGGTTGGGEENPPASTVSYKKVTTVTSGKEYLIVANGKAAQTLTGNYGYLKVADVTDNNGVIETEAGNGFVFTTTTGGYTITDANSKYVYMKGTYNSFNVDTTMPASGAIWTVEPKSDGTFVITNVEMNKSIQFDSQYNSYGAYPEVKGTMPALYEKVD